MKFFLALPSYFDRISGSEYLKEVIMENNFSAEELAASKEALDVLRQTINKIKSLNAFSKIDPSLLSMTSGDIADALAKKINFKEFTNPSNSD